MCIQNSPIVLQYDRHPSSSAVKQPPKFHNDYLTTEFHNTKIFLNISENF